MKLIELIQKNRDEILRIADKHGADRIQIFGSAIHGDDRQDSDVDLLVEAGTRSSKFFPGGLIVELERLLSRSVHVVCSASLHHYIREKIFRGARPL